LGNLVKIDILDQEFTIRTSAEKELVGAAAELVRSRTEEYRSASRTNVKLNVAILAALDIANELLELKSSHQLFRDRVEARSKEMIEAIEAEVGSQSPLRCS